MKFGTGKTPFAYSFLSPYDIPDTIDAFLQVIEAAYASDRIEITACPRGREPLTDALYAIHPDDQRPNVIELIHGNKARKFWKATITFKPIKGQPGTYGEVVFDRPKNKIASPMKSNLIAARITLQRTAGFKIVKSDY